MERTLRPDPQFLLQPHGHPTGAGSGGQGCAHPFRQAGSYGTRRRSSSIPIQHSMAGASARLVFELRLQTLDRARKQEIFGFAIGERGPFGEPRGERPGLIGERVNLDDAIDKAGVCGLSGRQRLVEHQKLSRAARTHLAGEEIGTAAVADSRKGVAKSRFASAAREGRRIEAEAEAIIRDLGVDAYSEARQRDRPCGGHTAAASF